MLQTARKPKCWIIYSVVNIVFANTISSLLAEEGMESLMGPRDIAVGTKEWLDWAETASNEADCAIVLISEAAIQSKNVDKEMGFLLVAVDRKHLPVFPISLTKELDRHPELPSHQTQPLWLEANPLVWIKQYMIPEIIRCLEPYWQKPHSYGGWRGLSQALGTFPSLREQLDHEGYMTVLAVDSAAVLQFWPEGVPLSQIHIKPCTGSYALDTKVRQAIGGRRSDYSGPSKLLLSGFFGANSDVTDLTLSGSSLDPNTIKTVHDFFGLAEAAIGIDLKLFDLARSQIPNFLVLHVISTVSSGTEEFVLLGRRRDDVKYYPGFWAASWEEQVNIDDDGWSIEESFRRGLKQEIVSDPSDVAIDRVSAFAILREFDNAVPPTGPEKISAAVCNTGLALYCPLVRSFDEVLARWWKPEDAQREFTDLVGVRLTVRNIETLIDAASLDFTTLPDGVRYIPETSHYHRGRTVRLHPTTRLRLLGLLALRFPMAFDKFVKDRSNPHFQRSAKSRTR